MKKLVVIILAALFAVNTANAAAERLPSLSRGEAKSFMEDALLRHPRLNFKAAIYPRVNCSHRNNRISRNCKLGWYVGDVVFWGYGKIWFSWRHNRAFWNYAYNITSENTYCSEVEHRSNCRRHYVVR